MVKSPFSADDAAEAAALGKKVRVEETSPKTPQAVVTAQGILTQEGNAETHAAVVARGMGSAALLVAGEGYST